ncbi:hypothetical protein M6B38_223415 [Iris pallida]|uniref:Uncharacterized protein n=1 Tax=Iris pallida TaxID=29817 RepID=A0AAX6DVY1_IRIPA|nr:hypothetical protein M6B38_223415 [Iris pallida]
MSKLLEVRLARIYSLVFLLSLRPICCIFQIILNVWFNCDFLAESRRKEKKNS